MHQMDWNTHFAPFIVLMTWLVDKSSPFPMSHGCPTKCPLGDECVKYRGMAQCWPMRKYSKNNIFTPEELNTVDPLFYGNLLQKTRQLDLTLRRKQMALHRLDKAMFHPNRRHMHHFNVEPVEFSDWKGNVRGFQSQLVPNRNILTESVPSLEATHQQAVERVKIVPVTSLEPINLQTRQRIDNGDSETRQDFTRQTTFTQTAEERDRKTTKAPNFEIDNRSEFSRRIDHAFHKTFAEKMVRRRDEATEPTSSMSHVTPKPNEVTPIPQTVNDANNRDNDVIGTRPGCVPCGEHKKCTEEGHYCFLKLECAMEVCQPLNISPRNL